MADIGVDAEIERIRLEVNGSNPPTPSAAHSYLFAKSDGVYVKDESGTVTGPFGTGGGGGAPSGPAGGDLAGTYPDPTVQNDSHAHTGATLSGVVKSGDAAGGDLGGTYPNPSVQDDSHGHTAATLALAHSNLSSVTSDQHHAQLHQAAHNSGGGDALKLDDLGAPDDNTDLNVSASAHGLTPKTPNDATKFLDGTAAYDTVKDSDLSTSDITTNDATTSKHGFVPKPPNDTTKFYRGDGTYAVPPGGTLLDANTTPVGNVGAGEDNLITYTVPANTLDANGQYLHFVMAGTFAATIANKRVRAYFGTALLIDTGVLAITAAGDWLIEGWIVRTGAATQRCIVELITNEAALLATTDYVDATEDLTAGVVLKATGEATNTDDIIEKFALTEKGGGTSTGGGTFPVAATMWGDENTLVAGAGTLVPVYDDLQFYQIRCEQVTPADANAWSWSCFLAAGTYTLSVIGLSGPDHGKLDWSVDGGAAGITAQDWYSASNTRNVTKTGTLTVLTSGVHTIKALVNGKHASSTNYYADITKLWLK